jgi:hypothetical protein
VHRYDPHHRNPMYCRAEQECIWELKKMAAHFHPTVALFANNIVKVISLGEFLLLNQLEQHHFGFFAVMSAQLDNTFWKNLKKHCSDGY